MTVAVRGTTLPASLSASRVTAAAIVSSCTRFATTALLVFSLKFGYPAPFSFSASVSAPEKERRPSPPAQTAVSLSGDIQGDSGMYDD